MKKPIIRDFAPATSTFGGVLPHIDFLADLALKDKTARSWRESQLEKNQNERKRNLERYKNNKLNFYKAGSFIVRKDLVASYLNGDISIPAKHLALGYRLGLSGILPDDEDLVRRNSEWQQFAVSIFDKLVDQLTDKRHIKSKFSYKPQPHPESWNTLARVRLLLVKRILVQAHTLSAQLMFDDYAID